MIHLEKKHIKLFEAKVDKDLVGCWEWQAGLGRGKYGKFMAGRETLRAHRVAYELYKGPIPDGLMVRHMCFNPKCVNPKHLEVGTAKDNAQDTVRSGRQARPRGSKDGMAKLKECDIPFIRSSSLTSPVLARMYGVSKTTILRVKSRERWGHL